MEVLESILLLSASALASAPATGVAYSPPIVITRGGTYQGSWKSDDPNRPAVTIKTAEPVTIESSTITGRGDLIATDIAHVDLTVRNCTGLGMNPDVRGKTPGRFVTAEGFDRMVLAANYLKGTSGIYLADYAGNRSANQTIKVVRNRALNIDGRKSDGQGGYLPFNTRRRITGGPAEDGFEPVQFVQFNADRHLSNAEIAWNQVINEPGKSRVEDNISIYQSSGTGDDPIRIHDNFIRGAYTTEPWQDSYRTDGWRYDWSYSGGGIMLGDGASANADIVSSHVWAYRNQVVSTTNYGIAISSGFSNALFANRIVSSGLLADGRRIAAQNVGAYVWDSSHDRPRGTFFNNVGRLNAIGWVNADGRNDWWRPDASRWSMNRHWPGKVTLATESAELEMWRAKTEAAGVTIGPAPTAAPR